MRGTKIICSFFTIGKYKFDECDAVKCKCNWSDILSTIYDILKEYPDVDNLQDFLDSDILILPNKKNEGSFGTNQPLELALQNKNLKIKCYSNGKPLLRFEACSDSLLELGVFILINSLNYIDSLMTLSDLIEKKYGNRNVKYTIIHGDVYNNCTINNYQGNGSDVAREMLPSNDNSE